MATGRLPGPLGLPSIRSSLGLFAPFMEEYPDAPAPKVNRPGPLPPPPRPPSGTPLSRTKPDERPAQMNLLFNPTKSRLVFRCDRIVFAQTCQVVADGKVIKPGDFTPSWKYRDTWALDNGWFLDLLEKSPGPYYDMVVAGYHKESPPGSGKVISDPASMGDGPHIDTPKIMFDPGKHPKGFKAVTFKLETFATCASGVDQGKWYEGALWEWALTWEEYQANHPGQARIVSLNVSLPSKDFLAAFDKYKQVKSQGKAKQ